MICVENGVVLSGHTARGLGLSAQGRGGRGGEGKGGGGIDRVGIYIGKEKT